MFTFVTSCCSPHISTSQQKSSTECLIWCQSGCVRILPFDRLRGFCHSTVSIGAKLNDNHITKIVRYPCCKDFLLSVEWIDHTCGIVTKTVHITLPGGERVRGSRGVIRGCGGWGWGKLTTTPSRQPRGFSVPLLKNGKKVSEHHSCQQENASLAL